MRRSAAAIIVIVGLALVGGVALARRPIPTVTSNTWTGLSVFKGNLKGLGKVVSAPVASIAVDGAGNFTYTNSDGVDIDGTLVQDGKKVLFTLPPAAISDLESELADIIVEALTFEGIDPGTVTVAIDTASIRSKGKAKGTKNGNLLKFALKLKFIATSSIYGPRKGKMQTKGLLFQAAGIQEN